MENNACIHCGADCGKSPVIWNDQKFCCNGCVQVFQLLNEANLSQYYSFESNPGIRVEQVASYEKYAFLDKEEVQNKLFDFKEEHMAKVTFYIPTIHCASCIWLLEHLNKLNRGVKFGAVNFVKKEYTVSFDTREISLRQLVELLVSIHYIPDISLQSLEKKDPKRVDKRLLYKIGVAGFVFGNVMLYSLPEYFNGEPIGGSLGTFLYWLCYILTVPLVFYSGSDYLISASKNLVKGIVNIDLPIAIGILALFVVTSYEVISGTGPGYSDSLSGFLFFLLVGRWYQSKTYQSLAFDRDYKSYFPVAVTKVAAGQEENTLLKDIQVGDFLLIRSKELIPADAILEEGNALIDYSFVTGESTPVQKKKGDFLYAGGIQTSGSIKVSVRNDIEQSHLTQLWNQSKGEQLASKSLISIIDKISQYFTLIIIAIAVLGFVYWYFSADFRSAILVLTSVLIVACPCALALSLPFTFGSTMRIFGRLGFYIKNTEVIEKLTKIDTLVFDKTGTLTKPDENNIQYKGEVLSDELLDAIYSVARQSAHPLSFALAKFYKNRTLLTVDNFVEVAGRGVYGKVKDTEIRLGSADYVGSNVQDVAQAASKIFVAVNNNATGVFTISNKYRQGIASVVKKLSSTYKEYLISGDNDAERNNLEQLFHPNRIYFNQSPQSKMEFIKSLQSQGKNVLMTGDGLNDAGAFMQSNVALSIADDIYHFSPAGDAIVDASKFSMLDRFIHFSKDALVIVKINFAISFLYNVVGLSFAISGNMSPVIAALLMPISSISVVVFASFATQLWSKRVFRK